MIIEKITKFNEIILKLKKDIFSLNEEEFKILLNNKIHLSFLIVSSINTDYKKNNENDITNEKYHFIKKIPQTNLKEYLDKDSKNIQYIPEELQTKEMIIKYLEENNDYNLILNLNVVPEKLLAKVLIKNLKQNQMNENTKHFNNFKLFFERQYLEIYDEFFRKRNKELETSYENRKNNENHIKIENYHINKNEQIQKTFKNVVLSDIEYFKFVSNILNFNTKKELLNFMIENNRPDLIDKNLFTQDIRNHFINIDIIKYINFIPVDFIQKKDIDETLDIIKNDEKNLINIKFYENNFKHLKNKQELITKDLINTYYKKDKNSIINQMANVDLNNFENEIIFNAVKKDIFNSHYIEEYRWNDDFAKEFKEFIEKDLNFLNRLKNDMDDDVFDFKYPIKYSKYFLFETSPYEIIKDNGDNFFKIPIEEQNNKLLNFALKESKEEKLRLSKLLININNINLNSLDQEIIDELFKTDATKTFDFLKEKNLLNLYFNKKHLIYMSKRKELIKQIPIQYLDNDNLLFNIVLYNTSSNIDILDLFNKEQLIDKNSNKIIKNLNENTNISLSL